MQTESGIYGLPAALPLECDELLIAPQVGYETYGELRGNNAVLLLHGLSHSPHAAGTPEAWFDGVIGEGKPLDTRSFYVISANLLGSPFGSSSPLTVDVETREPYGVSFPPVTVTDMARAAGGLCRGLGAQRLRGVVGLALGGMVALRLAGLFPDLVDAVATLGATAALPDSFRRRLATVRPILETDRDYRSGYYRAGAGPKSTLRRIRLEHLRDLHGPDQLAQSHGDLFASEHALEAEAEAFSQTFDARCYATLCEAYARADLHEQLGRIKARALVATCASDALAPPERTRDTYHRLTASGVSARYHELQGDAGHRAYYASASRVGEMLREFIGGPR